MAVGVLDMGAEIGDLDDRAVASDSAAMILTCPECATSYFVEDAAIGEGRTVRCTACSASWRAYVETPPLEEDPEPQPEHEPIEAVQAADEDEDLFERPPADLPGDELHKVFRARAETERRVREAAAQGAVWAGMGAALALIVTSALVFRIDVVKLWPRAASAYAAIGLPVNRVGLTIENVRALPGLQDGRAALVVSGLLRNIRARPVLAPPLSITLLDKDGRKLMVRSVSPGDPLVPAGQTRTFAVSVLDPPSAATDLEVIFLLDRLSARPRPSPATIHPSPSLTLRSAAPKPQSAAAPQTSEEARPLPATSPYALNPGSEGH